MALSKSKKKSVYENVKKAIADSNSVVFVNFHGLSVGDSTKMRKQFKQQGVHYTVAKKTIASKVLSEAGYSGQMPSLAGELGLAYGKDLIAPAREVFSFEKSLDNKISIQGGVFEGRFVGKEEMLSIASIPSLKTLYAQLVNLINSPLQGFVMAIDQIAQKKESATPVA